MDVKDVLRIVVAEEIGWGNEIIMNKIGQGNELRTGSAPQKLTLKRKALGSAPKLIKIAKKLKTCDWIIKLIKNDGGKWTSALVWKKNKIVGS